MWKLSVRSPVGILALLTPILIVLIVPTGAAAQAPPAHFSGAVSYNSGTGAAWSAAVADVNLDGKPDLLVANDCITVDCTSGGVSALLGNGDGTFQSAVTYASGGSMAASVAVADLTGDGKPDLVVSQRQLQLDRGVAR